MDLLKETVFEEMILQGTVPYLYQLDHPVIQTDYSQEIFDWLCFDQNENKNRKEFLFGTGKKTRSQVK